MSVSPRHDPLIPATAATAGTHAKALAANAPSMPVNVLFARFNAAIRAAMELESLVRRRRS
jgi:hypothetical protein